MELSAESEEMEMFWFFWLQFRRAYDSAYDSDFLFSLGYNHSYDSTYDSVASENHILWQCFLMLHFMP